MQPDERTPLILLRQWREVEAIRRQLIKRGLLDSKATAEDVVAAIRKAIPSNLFGNVAPPQH